MAEKLVIVGAGVAGVNAATKLVDNGFPGENITIIDMGKEASLVLVVGVMVN
jgi:NADH dehydrogenase FAD-containing subunit